MTRTMLSVACAASLALFANTAQAQSFIAPVSEVPTPAKGFVTTVDGTEIAGQVTMMLLVNGKLKWVKFKEADGTKHKLKAADVQELKVKMTALAKMDATLDGLDAGLLKIAKTDFSEIAERDYAVYGQALLPGGKAKYAVLQLLNPGYDSRIQVFMDPNANETKGIAGITGGEDKSYYVVKDDERSMKVKKGQYKKKVYPDLFSDCAEMANHEALGDKVRFVDFSVHTFIYDQVGGAAANDAPAAEPAAEPAAAEPAAAEPAAEPEPAPDE